MRLDCIGLHWRIANSPQEDDGRFVAVSHAPAGTGPTVSFASTGPTVSFAGTEPIGALVLSVMLPRGRAHDQLEMHWAGAKLRPSIELLQYAARLNWFALETWKLAARR